MSEAELMELNALCQVLPGPTSTQTLTSLGHRLGGATLAYLTLLIWMFPSVMIMTSAGILVSHFGDHQSALAFTRFIQPIAVGFVGYAAYSISLKNVTTKVGLVLMVLAGVSSYFIQSPYVFPIVFVISGAITAVKFKEHPKEKSKPIKIVWANFFLWAGVLVGAAVLGGVTKTNPDLLPIRLFENFYRNGSLIFGGGQALTPMLYTEFVEFARKQYLTTQEFLSGFALSQSLPGPTFSFCAYIGAMAMKEYGIGAQFFGGIMSALGVFLPGTFLIFFVIKIWDNLKKFRPIRASLEGILAASSGIVAAMAIHLFQPLEDTVINYVIIAATICLMTFTRISAWVIILIGVIAGLIF